MAVISFSKPGDLNCRQQRGLLKLFAPGYVHDQLALVRRKIGIFRVVLVGVTVFHDHHRGIAAEQNRVPGIALDIIYFSDLHGLRINAVI